MSSIDDVNDDDRSAALPDHPRQKRLLSRSPDQSPADASSHSPDHKRARINIHKDTATHYQSKSPSIIESAVSHIRIQLKNRLDKLKEKLHVWERNGFVNPGCELPPIADPQLYFLFSNPNLFHELSERIEAEEFLGDRIYGASLVHVLEQWRYPRQCCTMLHFVFTSNMYQKRLFHEWKIPRFFVQSRGNSLSGKCYANALEAYCSIASKDPLYEFSMTTFKKKLAAVLQHALLPLLEYIAEIYELPPDTFDDTLSIMEDFKFHPRTEKHVIESEPTLQHILQKCQDKVPDKSNNSYQLWKSNINISVPNREDHEFWTQSSIDPNRIVQSAEDSTLLQVSAFGSSEQDANFSAKLKLINLIILLREILRRRREIKDMKSLISNIFWDSTISSFSEMRCNETFNIGVQLFMSYSLEHDGIWVKDGAWCSIINSIEAFSKKCPTKLRPLLKYYLTYPLIRKNRLIEAFEILNSLKNQNSFALSTLVLRRLEEVEQMLCLLGQTLPQSLGDVFPDSRLELNLGTILSKLSQHM